jgi:hypothetical protein
LFINLATIGGKSILRLSFLRSELWIVDTWWILFLTDRAQKYCCRIIVLRFWLRLDKSNHRNKRFLRSGCRMSDLMKIFLLTILFLYGSCRSLVKEYVADKASVELLLEHGGQNRLLSKNRLYYFVD